MEESLNILTRLACQKPSIHPTSSFLLSFFLSFLTSSLMLSTEIQAPLDYGNTKFITNTESFIDFS